MEIKLKSTRIAPLADAVWLKSKLKISVQPSTTLFHQNSKHIPQITYPDLGPASCFSSNPTPRTCFSPQLQLDSDQIARLRERPNPYNKWSQRTVLQTCAPQKFKSHEKTKFIKTKNISNNLFNVEPQSLILNIEETKSTTRLLTIIGTKIYQPPQKKNIKTTLWKRQGD